MFGNWLGWSFSAVIILAAGGLLFWLHGSGTRLSAPGPIGRNAARYSLELSTPPRAICKDWMTEDGDATDLYWQAIAEYLDKYNYNDYDNYNGSPEPQHYEKVRKGIELLLEAGRKKRGGVFASKPDKVITYEIPTELRKAMPGLYQAALKAAAYYTPYPPGSDKIPNLPKREPNPAKARDMYRSLFVTGMRMYEERLVYEEWYVARKYLSVASFLYQLADSDEERQQYKAFDAQFLPLFKQSIEPVQQITFVANPGDPDHFKGAFTWAGDMAALATTKGADHTWRIEGTLQIGRGRFLALTQGDRFGCNHLLKKLEGDEDRNVRLAARKGLEVEMPTLQRQTFVEE
jgi:hypothetical protein